MEQRITSANLTNESIIITSHNLFLLLNRMKQLCCISVSESNLENAHPKCLDNIFVYMLPKEIIMNVLKIIGNITIDDFSLFKECYEYK